MFQGLQNGATVYVLYKNDMRIENARVTGINTHLPQFNAAQPTAMLNGMVTDINLVIGSDTVPFAGIPATASVADFPDKGLFISEDEGLVLQQVKTIRDNHQRIVDGYEPSKEMVSKCDALLLSRNPEKQREMRSQKEMSEMKEQLAEMKRMLSSILGSERKEN